MSIVTQPLRYGWVALASLGILTGTTIYVLNNTRKTIKAEDIIELALGVTERCLALQLTTNPTYSVAPPTFVRTWYSNVYTSDGVTIYTNIITNTIGWQLDRDMMIELDTTISNLIPYYIATNSLNTNDFNAGNTNIPYLTVTGLWASLGIGDGTNKFTRTPGWTNALETNAPTYGDYPWQIYEEDLVERYKVLNELAWVKDYATIVTNALSEDKYAFSDFKTNWDLAKAQAISMFAATNITVTNFPSNDIYQHDCFRKYRTLNTHPVSANAYRAGIAVQRIQFSLNIPSGSVTQLPTTEVIGALFLSPGNMVSSIHNAPYADFYPGFNYLFDSGADGFIESNYTGFAFSTLGSNTTEWIGTLDDTIEWPAEPIPLYTENTRGYYSLLWDFTGEQKPLQYLFVKYQFNYCTNRFW